MKKIFYIVIPTLIAYISFFLLYNLLKEGLFEYRWLAVIPFTIITVFTFIENRKEWRLMKGQA